MKFSMVSRIWSQVAVSVLVLAGGVAWATEVATPQDRNTLEQALLRPPESARPWVYWFWLNGNITREGITADLEAMKRVGIGGVLIMEVDQGAPLGKVSFAGQQWRELFKFMLGEANRLGLQVNMCNDAGWCGSGGPWITPELSMQYLVWTETSVDGGRHFDAPLPQPKPTADYYRDITVLAFPRRPARPASKISKARPATIARISRRPRPNIHKCQPIRSSRAIPSSISPLISTVAD